MFLSFARNPKAGEVIFVIDALDEFGDHGLKLLIDSLTTLLLEPNSVCNFKFLATSRPYDDIRCNFRKLEDNFPEIRLSGESEAEVAKISQEINLVVKHIIENIVRDKGLLDDEHAFVTEQLDTRKDPERTYLWVTLTLEFIKETKSFTKGEVRKALGTDIPQKKAIRLLQIILAAKRPLSLEELSVAMAVKRADQTSDEVFEYMEPVERFKTTIRGLCGLLLWFSDDKVYLLYQTVRDFLVLKESPQDKPPSLTSNGTLKWQGLFSTHELNSVLGKNILHWYIHLRASPSSDNKEEEKILDMAVQVCTAGSREYARWSPFYNSQIFGPGTPEHATSLITASWLGILGVVKKILQDGSVNIESTDSRRRRTSLSWAAKHGHSDVVELLLEAGAEIDARAHHQRTPLLLAAKKGHSDVVKVLLEAGAEVDARDHYQGTPLSYSAGQGYSDMVKLLLETGAEVDVRDKNQETPLSYAARHGYFDVMKLLLEAGAEVDVRDENQETPLSHAARRGRSDVVKLLLEAGAEVDSRDIDQRTPLQYADQDSEDYSNTAKLLLEAGADVYLSSMSQRIPLSCAASQGYSDVVKFLLEAGAEGDSRDSDERTPLSLAAGRGRSNVVELLLEAGAEVDSRDIDQRTPLSCTAQDSEGHSNAAKLLLEAGAVPAIGDDDP
ncbi:uncharacterized protein N7483_008487 [Penicillium malachiteum]|uniref:uncharacterized protein n=1 Tax=Penicillium malachiteum TaxID=1324776 RepID=UPI0025482690|nr:uncharacterized protein N7483_008487 [Penicillium malachiteum]KAJ5720553.1 hypothetical protein N7483_008487 [Penicillium malachiteum]